MKTQSRPYRTIRAFIALVWLVNGLFCKVLNLVPRHQQIVEQILGTGHSRLLTVLIGISEIVMTIWILSNYRSRLNAITQMLVIGTMNILEFLFVPQLLLWGRYNSVFAVMFIALIYYNEFKLNKGTQ
ncbi:MAG: DoxX-like family protein [Lewinellaceae bacterium]|nr:DoxX-like family protein [Lewinellaceae bacterium]